MPPKYGLNMVEIFKSGRTTEKLVDQVKIWLTATDYPVLTDEQIVHFLLACNNDVHFTQTTIKENFDCKSEAPELFDNRNMDTEILRQAANLLEISVAPIRTEDNYAVILCRLKDTSFYNFNLESSIKLFFMCMELVLFKDPPNGLVAIFDMKGVGLMHLTKFRISPVKNFFHYLQDAVPCQLKAIHVINSVYFFDRILSLCKPFMNETTLKLLHLHRSDLDMNEFYRNSVSQDCMPEDYGGELAEQVILSENSYQALRELKEFFTEEEMQRKLCVVKG